MQAWLLEKLGSLANMHLGDVAEPTPGPQDVVMELAFAGLNPADRYLAQGEYPARPELPHILGRDGVGRIVSVGTEVKNWKPGDQALILRGPVGVERAGTFAQLAAVPADSLAKIPHGWSLEQAAGASLVYLTAYQALTQWDDLKKPGRVLITGASGGVGVAGVQLAKALGHIVAVLSRSVEKQEKLLAIGADIALSPQDTQWRKKLSEALGQRRVDLAIDNIGGELFPEIIDTLGMFGRISVVGRLAGPVPQFNTASLFFRRNKIGGVAVATYSPEESRVVWTHVTKLLKERKARPLVDSVHPFAQLPAAFTRLAAGPMGKVLLRVGGVS